MYICVSPTSLSIGLLAFEYNWPILWFYSDRLSCSEPVGLQLHPDLKYPEHLPPCPVTKEQAVAVSTILPTVTLFSLAIS